MSQIVDPRGPRRLSPIEWVASGGAIPLLVSVLPLALIGERIAQVAKARAWTVEGPPCPPLSRDAYLKLRPVAHVIDYEGVQFGRGYGYVSCIVIADHGGRGLGTFPVC